MPDAALPETGYLPLDTDASVYVTADVVNARPILDHMVIGAANNKQFAQMLDRTHFAVAAAYLPGAERRFQLYAQGNFPVGRAKIAFGISRSWKKQRSRQSGETYWYSKKDNLSVALEPQQAFIVAAANNGESSSDPFFTGQGIKIPDGFDEFSKKAVLSFWMEKPGEIINRKFHEMGLPLEFPAELVFFSFFQKEGEIPATDGNRQYTANIRIQFSGEAQARAFTAIMGFAGGFIPHNTATGEGMLASLLFSNPPVQDGRNLNIKTNTMNAQEISLLFSLFSL